MTALRPAPHGGASPAIARATELNDADLPALVRLLDADPIVNAVISARVRTASSLASGALGGQLLGVRRNGELVAACYNGGNLITIGDHEDPAAWTALAGAVVRRPRRATAIVGRREPVAAVWQVLVAGWPRPRAVRHAQPLLMIDQPPVNAGNPNVRPADLGDLDRYLSAAAAMFTEELEVSPHVSPGTAPFRARIAELLRGGRAFAAFDFRGQVTFKADIGAVTPHTCQIQGVWVRPDLRGRGLGTACLASVLRHALTLAPTVSLYVNDFNRQARRVYEKLGMHQLATLSTVLL